MNNVEKELFESYESIKDMVKVKPDVALVLGSGLGEFANQMTDVSYIDYKDIKGFPVSTVSGHVGRYVIGKIDNVNVIAMQGRVHYYEGYSMDKVVMPIRIMKLLGAEKLILTNAAGGINLNFKAGDLMRITDNITTFVPSPLIGPNIEKLGTRFPDMSSIYDKDMAEIMDNVAKELNIDLKNGVYVQTTGPSYETPAEIKMFRTLGADAVGMSTVCEAMVARHMGMKVAGISCICNMAAGIDNKELNHEEVKLAADMASEKFTKLVKEFIKKLA